MKLKRILSILCAAGMACTALPASGEGAVSGGLSEASNALIGLLFDTSNVTLDADASFTYDGVEFKTIKAHLVQDDFKTAVSADYFTVRPNGSSYTTSMKVHAIMDNVWYYNSHDGEYYSESYTEPSDSVISHSKDDDTLIALAGGAMELADLAMPSLSQSEETENGKRITLSLKGDSVPSYFNTLANMLINRAAQRYMSLYLNDEMYGEGSSEASDPDGETEYLNIIYEDDILLAAHILTESRGTEVTAEDVNKMLDSEDPAVTEAYNTMVNMVDEAAKGYDHGYLYIAADGTCNWYATQEEMILAEDQRWIAYEDEDAAFIVYMQSVKGETLTEDDIRGIYWGSNMELWDEFVTLEGEMGVYYLELLGDHPVGYVRADGTLEPVDDVDAFYAEQYQDEGRLSIAQDALLDKASVSIQDSTVVFDLDSAGCITSVTADIAVDFVNHDGSVHPVTMHLTAAASDRGESKVGDFDPEEWGVVGFLEYYRMSGSDDPSGEEIGPDYPDGEETIPETVTLNGVTYPVNVD